MGISVKQSGNQNIATATEVGGGVVNRIGLVNSNVKIATMNARMDYPSETQRNSNSIRYALSPSWLCFVLKDHDLVQVCKILFDLLLSLPFLSSPAKALAFSHKSHIRTFICYSHIKFMFSLLRILMSTEISFVV